MYVRLTLALIIAVLLSGTHWKAYVEGRKAIRAEFVEKMAEQERVFRDKEQKLVKAKHKEEVKYAALKKVNQRAAAGARDELGRLQHTLTERQASVATASCPGAHGASVERELLREGAEALVGLAAEVDRTKAQLTGLQAYVSSVCLVQ